MKASDNNSLAARRLASLILLLPLLAMKLATPAVAVAELRVGILVPATALQNGSGSPNDTTLVNTTSLLMTARVIVFDLNYVKHLIDWSPQLVLNAVSCRPLAANALPNATELLAPGGVSCKAATGPQQLAVEDGSQEAALAAVTSQLGWERLVVVVDSGAEATGLSQLLDAVQQGNPDASAVMATPGDARQAINNTGRGVGGFILAFRSAEKLHQTVGQLCNSTLMLWSPLAVPPGPCGLCYLSPALSSANPAPAVAAAVASLPLSVRQADILAWVAQVAASASDAAAALSAIRTAFNARGGRFMRQHLRCRGRGGGDQLAQSGSFGDDGSVTLDASRFPVSSGYLVNRTVTVELKMVAPFSFPGNRDSKGFEHNVTGLSIDMLNEIASRLKFRYRLRQPEDGNWGAPYPNGTWNGMVGDVLRKQADFAIGPFTMTAIRETVIDFSVAFMQDGNAMLIQKPGQENPMFRVLSPFSLHSWLAILGSMVGSAFFIFAYSRISPFSGWNLGLPDKIRDEVSYKENLWSAVGTLLQQGQDFFPVAGSARVVLGLWWCTVVVIMALYTADMIGYLTLNLPATSIQNLEQLADQSVIRPIVKSGANAYTLFQKSPSGSTYNKIFQLMGDMPTFTETDQGVNLVKGLTNPGRQYAFIGDRTQLSYAALTNCDLMLLSDVFNVATFGWPMSVDAPFKGDINREIQRLVDSGMMSRWIKKWWSAENICAVDSSLSDAKPVDLVQASGTFIILAGFFGVGTVVLLLECLITQIARCCTRRKKRSGWQYRADSGAEMHVAR